MNLLLGCTMTHSYSHSQIADNPGARESLVVWRACCSDRATTHPTIKVVNDNRFLNGGVGHVIAVCADRRVQQRLSSCEFEQLLDSGGCNGVGVVEVRLRRLLSELKRLL